MKTPKEWANEYRRDLSLSLEQVIREAMADAWREATKREREKLTSGAVRATVSASTTENRNA